MRRSRLRLVSPVAVPVSTRTPVDHLSPVHRQFVGLVDTSQLRTAQFAGTTYLVVPVVALVGDSVVRPLNSACPEFVPAEELSLAVAWNGRPVVPDHPDEGRGSANTPSTLERWQFGIVFNSRYEDSRLKMEAWLDPARAKSVGIDAVSVINRCQSGEMVEVSVGCYITPVPQSGTHNGQSYGVVWRDVVPDHLAMLPIEKTGACSIDAGCGAPRANQLQLTTVNRLRTVNRPRTIGQSQTVDRDRSNTSTSTLWRDPMTLRERVKALLLGTTSTTSDEAGEEAAELVYYQTIATTLDQASMSLTSARTIAGQLIADETESPTETPEDEAAEEEIEAARLDSIYALCMQTISSLYATMQAVYSAQEAEADDEEVQLVYIVNSDGSRTPSTLVKPKSLSGRRNSAADQKTIQAVHDQSVSLGADCPTVKANSSSRSGRSGHKHTCTCNPASPTTTAHLSTTTTEGTDVDKDKFKPLVARLLQGQATEEDQATLTKEFGEEVIKSAAGNPTPNPTQTPSPTPTPAGNPGGSPSPTTGNPSAPSNPSTPSSPSTLSTSTAPTTSDEQWLSSAPEHVRRLVNRSLAEETARRSYLVGLLTKSQTVYTEDRLKAMSTEELQDTCSLLKLGEDGQLPKDFSGQVNLAHFSTTKEEEDIYLNPPDPYDLKGLEAARKAKGVN